MTNFSKRRRLETALRAAAFQLRHMAEEKKKQKQSDQDEQRALTGINLSLGVLAASEHLDDVTIGTIVRPLPAPSKLVMMQSFAYLRIHKLTELGDSPLEKVMRAFETAERIPLACRVFRESYSQLLLAEKQESKSYTGRFVDPAFAPTAGTPL